MEVSATDFGDPFDDFIGCGRFFEGTAEEMHTALNKTLISIPDDTTVYVRVLSSKNDAHG